MDNLEDTLNSTNSDYIKLTDLSQLTVNSNEDNVITYIVDSIVNTITVLDSNPNIKVDIKTDVLYVKIANNIRLIFDGGKIEVPSSYPTLILEGSCTNVYASPCQIFGENVDVLAHGI